MDNPLIAMKGEYRCCCQGYLCNHNEIITNPTQLDSYGMYTARFCIDRL